MWCCLKVRYSWGCNCFPLEFHQPTGLTEWWILSKEENTKETEAMCGHGRRTCSQVIFVFGWTWCLHRFLLLFRNQFSLSKAYLVKQMVTTWSFSYLDIWLVCLVRQKLLVSSPGDQTVFHFVSVAVFSNHLTLLLLPSPITLHGCSKGSCFCWWHTSAHLIQIRWNNQA